MAENLNEKAFIFGSIFTLSNRLQVLGDRFDRNITVKQWLLLVCIFKNGNEPLSVSEVAGLIGNSRQNVKKMALILQKQGFLALDRDAKDARSLKISLTEKCKDYFKQREEKELEFIERLFIGFDTDTLKVFCGGIELLEKNIIDMEKTL